MTPKQLATNAVGAIESMILNETMLNSTNEAIDALASMLEPVCQEKDCEETTLLDRCCRCGMIFCRQHIRFTTMANGYPDHICFGCTEPEIREY